MQSNNMQKPLTFSILVPNLGFSLFVEECFASLSRITTSNNFTFEIIICEQSDNDIFKKIDYLCKKYFKNIDYALFRQEKGLIKARETLMSIAKGDYFCFVDSDDCVESDFLINRYKSLLENNFPDLLVSNYKIKKGESIKKHIFKEESLKDIKDSFLFSSSFNPMWIKTFKKNLFSIKEVRDSSVINGEDWIVSYSIVKNAKTIAVDVDTFDYTYRLNTASVSNNLSLKAAHQQIFYRQEYLLNEKIVNAFQSKLFLSNQIRIFNISCKLVIKNKSMNFQVFCEFFDQCKSFIENEDKLQSFKGLGFKNRLFMFLLKHNFKRLYFMFLKQKTRKI